jgi:hypothetical protein
VKAGVADPLEIQDCDMDTLMALAGLMKLFCRLDLTIPLIKAARATQGDKNESGQHAAIVLLGLSSHNAAI